VLPVPQANRPRRGAVVAPLARRMPPEGRSSRLAARHAQPQ
jgi:hypothetical protein